MPQPQRSSDIVETHSERALGYGLTGLIMLAVGLILMRYQGEGWLTGLIWVLIVFGTIGIFYGLYCALQIRKVQVHKTSCPYCGFVNTLTDAPERDIACRSCNRMIPIVDGRVLPVQQVRCGYCNELNYYSEKTDLLICEYCNHEIPIAQADGQPRRHVPKGFALQDDDQLYELVLIAHGHKTEELISALQHMLALNRNQVKQMLTELPVTLLTGIPRKKAEMLQAQLTVHEAAAEFRPISSSGAPVR